MAQTEVVFSRLSVYSKTCLKRPLKKDQKLVFKTDYHLMQVKSLQNAPRESILQYVRPSSSYHLSIKTFVLSIFKRPF